MTIKVNGLDRLFRKLNAAAATQTLVPPTQRGTLRLRRRMQEYPPALNAVQGPTRAGAKRKTISRFRQPYKRTGTYGKRWRTKVTASGSGVEGRVGNNVKYGPFVGSARFQARIHAGRWNTDDKVVKEEQGAILTDYQQAIDKALGE